jgi:hypothetical protein
MSIQGICLGARARAACPSAAHELHGLPRSPKKLRALLRSGSPLTASRREAAALALRFAARQQLSISDRAECRDSVRQRSRAVEHGWQDLMPRDRGSGLSPSDDEPAARLVASGTAGSPLASKFEVVEFNNSCAVLQAFYLQAHVTAGICWVAILSDQFAVEIQADLLITNQHGHSVV